MVIDSHFLADPDIANKAMSEPSLRRVPRHRADSSIDAEYYFPPMLGQPILIYGADRPALTRALERALARNVTPTVYTQRGPVVHREVISRGCISFFAT